MPPLHTNTAFRIARRLSVCLPRTDLQTQKWEFVAFKKSKSFRKTFCELDCLSMAESKYRIEWNRRIEGRPPANWRTGLAYTFLAPVTLTLTRWPWWTWLRIRAGKN